MDKEKFSKKMEQLQLAKKSDRINHERVWQECVLLHCKTMPTLKIPISTVHVVQICKVTVEIFKSEYKLDLLDSDYVSLILVTLLQIEAKVFLAKMNNPLESLYRSDVFERVQKTKECLKKAVYPLSIYIAQIGEVNVNEQTLVPEVIDLKYENFSDYIEKLDISRKARDIIPNHQQIINNYLILMGKVANKVPKEFITAVDYEHAKGTTAQLVTSRFDNGSSRLRAWSHRDIDEDFFKIGALFRFGFEIDNFALRSHNGRCCEIFVNAKPLESIFPFVEELENFHNGMILEGTSCSRVGKPHCEINISTVYLIDLCTELVHILESHGVKITETDVNILVYITILQIETKLSEGSFSESTRFTRFNFKNALYPLSLYLEQIGTLEINGQTIRPVLCDLKFENISNYLIAFEKFNSGSVMLDYLSSKWHNFQLRVNQKLKNAFSVVDFTNVNGTEAQLVSSRQTKVGDIEHKEVWSRYKVDHFYMKMGALCHFGYNLEDEDDLHSYDGRYCQSSVYISRRTIHYLFLSVVEEIGRFRFYKNETENMKDNKKNVC